MSILGEWEKLAATLDDDLRLIYPAMYIDNQHLYDKICGIGYLVKDLQYPDSGLDWVSEGYLNTLLRNNPTVAVISKLLIVRIRLPWNEVDTEWLVSKQELEEHGDEYEVLETYLKVKPIGSLEEPYWLKSEDRQRFDEHRDDFEVVEMRYSVRWKWSEDEIGELLGVSTVKKENVHTYISE